jgi:CSLREA domain-containing protein
MRRSPSVIFGEPGNSSRRWFPSLWSQTGIRRDSLMKVLVVGIVAAAVVASPFPSPSVEAALVFLVDAPTDAEDANPGDGACLTLGGDCTLRAAVQEANATAGLDTVSLPAGTFTLSLGGVDEDASMTGDIDIVDDLTVVGAGPDSTVVAAGGIDRIFHILGADLEVTFDNLTLTGGVRGAILSEGNLEIANIVAQGNVAAGYSGIVENAGGTLVVSDSSII